MSDKINKSTLKEAKEQFEEIKNFAIEEATKSLSEEAIKKVIESSLGEVALNEDVTIQAGDTTIEIEEDGTVKINPEGQDTEHVFSSEENDEDEEDNDEDEIMVSDEDDEIEIDNSEIEEMNLEEMNFEEQEAAAPAPAPAPEAEAAPVEAPVEEPAAEEMGADEMANPFQALMDKMDQIMAAVGGGAPAGGEEIDIVDDTEAAPAPAPAPEAAPAPVAEEITFEVVNNEMEIPEMAGDDEMLEIVGEEEEETMEEVKMMGQSHSVQRTAGYSAGPAKAKEERERMAMRENKENKAQYEAKLAELIKENESLKMENSELNSELTKFENGFLKLQENFEKQQDYTAKLVMAYKVAMSGGLTNDQKIQISEQFDSCETVEEAEKLYKSIVSENRIKVNKNPEKSIKSTTIKSTPAKSVSQPLYESAEVSRMKQLAGIKKNEE